MSTGRMTMLPLMVVALSLLCACSSSPNKRLTGGCTGPFACGGRQMTIDLNEQERVALAAIQDRRYPRVSEQVLVEAAASVLRSAGFQHVVTDPVTGLVEGELGKRIAPEWVARAGGIILTLGKMPPPPLPDHCTVHALIVVRQNATTDKLMRVRFDITEWDAKGDSEVQDRYRRRAL